MRLHTVGIPLVQMGKGSLQCDGDYIVYWGGMQIEVGLGCQVR
jgi:hypothetical protein